MSDAPHRFDLLSIDAEGADYQVLEGLAVDEYRPHVICVEIWQSRQGMEALLKSEFHSWFRQRQYSLAGWSGLSAIYVDGR